MNIQIKTFKPEDHKVKALIYGPAGSGKTVFAGTAQKALFGSAEAGLLSIAEKSPSFVQINSFKDLMALYLYLKDEDHDYETVIIDSITEINEIIKLDIEKRTGHALQLQDWGEVAQKIADILRKFRDLPMHVLLIAQEQYINDEQKIKKIVPELNGRSAMAIARYMDIVGYIHIEADGQRWIETSTNRNLLTKDRTRKIGDDTPMDFNEWINKASEIKIGKQEIKREYSSPGKNEEVSKQTVTSHIISLKKELVARGAKDADNALKLLNQLCGTELVSFEIEESTASELLIRLLQLPMDLNQKIQAGIESSKEESFFVCEAHQEAGGYESCCDCSSGKPCSEAQGIMVKKSLEMAQEAVKKIDANKRQTALHADYTDPVKIKKFLDSLTTIREVHGLVAEIGESFKDGDMTESVRAISIELCMHRIQEISDGLLVPKKAKKVSKTIL